MYQQERWAKWSKMKSAGAAAPPRSDPSGFGWKAVPNRCHGQNADSKPSSQPLTFSKWHFLVLAQAWSKPSPLPWCCLLSLSRLLPICTNVGQDLSCLPEV